MASPSNATDPALPPAPSPAPYRHTFLTAPVGWVIAGMLLFWPTGIPALLASHRAARAFGAADAEAAQRESANARRWGIISVIVGGCVILLSMLAWIVSIALFVLAAHHLDNSGVWESGPGWSNQQPFGAPAPYRNG
ncbi:CD225/dispanin family protein [Cellulomonas sp. McL0617]|uniref:CD225/dispanin family protein n=1 Tax=Cellulomonas sp. McL0617 TaxID=3415675 RepID=UPI003CF40912